MDRIGWKVSEITQADFNALGLTNPADYQRMLTRNRRIAASCLVPLNTVGKGQTPRYHFREALKLSLLSHMAETGVSFSEIEKISEVIDPSLSEEDGHDVQKAYEVPLRIVAQRGVHQTPFFLDVLVVMQNGKRSYLGGYRKERVEGTIQPHVGEIKETRTFNISQWVHALWPALQAVKAIPETEFDD